MNLTSFLSNTLKMRMAIYEFVGTLMEIRNLHCACSEHEEEKECSTHAPLPLIYLILKRLYEFETLDLSSIDGCFHQMEECMMKVGLTDTEELERAYGMDENTQKYPVTLPERRERHFHLRVPVNQPLITAYMA